MKIFPRLAPTTPLASSTAARLSQGAARRLTLAALSAGAVIAAPSAAAGDVTKPFPGITLVRHPGESALVVVSLCTPGVSVRTTKYAERQKTPGPWAQSLNLEVAQNGDFFDYPGWTYVVGRARGAGQDWPASAQQKENRPYWQFGPAIASGVANGAVAPLAGVTEIVGGHNVIMSGGKTTGPWSNANDGQLLNTLHERSAVGISADGRTLYLLTTEQSITASTVVTWLINMASEAGAPPVDYATNQDGGGSAQMYVKGKGEIIATGRQVNNHLGIAAKGAGPSPQCNNIPPKGFLDTADCEGVVGWAQDTNTPDEVIPVHLYFNGAAGDAGATSVSVSAGVHRDDLCAAIGSCKHGFLRATPLSLLDGKPHAVHAYGIDSEGGANKELASSPKTITCSPPTITGVRRHVQDQASFQAWKFSAFSDMLTIDDAGLDALAESIVLPEEPLLMRADDGSPEVWLVDGTAGELRRHVPNPQIAAAWRLDLSTVVEWPAADVAALEKGPPLRPRPVLVKGSGPAVYAIDDELKKAEGAGGGGSGGTGDTGGTGGTGGAGGTGGTAGSGEGEEASGCACSAPTGRGSAGAMIGAGLLLALAWGRRRQQKAS